MSITFWGGTALYDQNLFFSIRLSIREYLNWSLGKITWMGLFQAILSFKVGN